jgi:ectoine hydroxylase
MATSSAELADYVESYHRDGFFVVHGMFSEQDSQVIRDANQECIKDPQSGSRVIYEEGDPSKPVRSVMGHHKTHRTLDYFTRHPSLVEVAEGLLESQVYVSQFKINTKAPDKEGGKRWDYHRGFTFWNGLDGIPKPDMFSLFIYLTEQTAENGAVYVLKGSHAGVTIDHIQDESLDGEDLEDRNRDTAEYLTFQIRPERIEQYEREFKRIVCVGNPGDVLVMHPLLLHASDGNLSDSSRDLMITVYNSVHNLPQHPREDYLCARDTRAIVPSTSI